MRHFWLLPILLFGCIKNTTNPKSSSRLSIPDTLIQRFNEAICTSDGDLYLSVCGRDTGYNINYKVYRIFGTNWGKQLVVKLGTNPGLFPFHLLEVNKMLYIASLGIGKDLYIFDRNLNRMDSIVLNYNGLNPTIEKEVLLANGNMLFSGSLNYNIYPYIAFSCFNQNMNLQWVKGTLPNLTDNFGSGCNKLLSLKDGNVMYFGYQYTEYNAATKDLLIGKLDDKGTVLFNKRYGDADLEEANDALDAGDGIIIAGTKRNNKSGIGIWLIKMDYNGDTISSKIIHSPFYESYFNLNRFYTRPQLFKIKDGYLLFYVSSGYGSDIQKVVVMKLDNNLNTIGYVLYGGVTGVGSSYALKDKEDNFVLCLITRDFVSNAMGFNIEILKLDNNGKIIL